MTPRHYVDIHLPGRLSPRQDDFSGLPMVASMVIRGLHGVFSEFKEAGEVVYALSLPDFDKASALKRIRVFSETEDQIHALIKELKESFKAMKVHFQFPEEVPSDYSGPCVAFTRYRIPTRSADFTGGALRIARLLQANKQCVHVTLKSQSNGNVFRFNIDKIDLGSGAPDKTESSGRLNSYGLSLSNHLVALPEI